MSTDLAARLTEFAGALRAHGMRVGPGETVDAAAAVSVLGLADREQLREGLAATLVTRAGHRPVFDAVFDLYFPAAVGLPQAVRDDPGAPPGQPERTPRGAGAPPDGAAAELRERLALALAADDAAAMRQLAAAAVEAFGRTGGAPGAGGGGLPGASRGGFSALQTLDRLQPQTLVAELDAGIRAADEPDAFTSRLGRDEARRRVERFSELVRAEARRRSAEARGREQVARHTGAVVDQVDFLAANRAQLAELRRTVQPMSKRLAGRLAARRRRARHGEIDVRRTFRRSLSTGGVPMRPAYRHHRPGRPEIVLLCDVSGSVAGFAHFTLMLVEALHDQFSRVRAFAFVEATDEVTHLVADNDADPATLAQRIRAEASVVRWDGHSDYGNALGEFAERHLDAVGPRTSVLILGDARTNGGNPNLAALREIAGRAKHAYWLNPESRRSWGTGDSVAPQYGRIVEMHECRNGEQLAQVISRLLPV